MKLFFMLLERGFGKQRPVEMSRRCLVLTDIGAGGGARTNKNIRHSYHTFSVNAFTVRIIVAVCTILHIAKSVALITFLNETS